MGIEIVEGHQGSGIVSRKLISQVVRSDRPLDGGWGYESEPEVEVPVRPDEIAREAVMDRAKAVAMAGVVVPQGGQVEFRSTLPYTGSESPVQAVVRQPIRHPDLPA